MFLQDHKKVALVYKDKHFSYSELLINAFSFSSLINIKKSEKVILFSENRPEWIFSFYGTWFKAGVNVPVDFMSAPDEVAYIIKDCKPVIVFCSNETEITARQAVKLSKQRVKLINFDKIKLKKISQPGKKNIYLDIPDYQKTAIIFYTSGTTGSPKGVMLSYENLKINIEAVMEAGIYNNKQKVLLLLPLHHVLPLMGTVLAVFFSGATSVISPSLNPPDIMKSLQDNGITMIIAVPRFYSLIHKKIIDKINEKFATKIIFKIVKAIGSKKISGNIFAKVHKQFGGHVDYMVSGGAALDKQVMKDFMALGFDVYEGYGMTETAPIITFPRRGNIKAGSVGQPLNGVDVKIIEDEIIVRGKNVMKGYLNLPGETNKAIKGGWLYTGDMGYLDKKNFLYITGRKKEIIVLGNGKNINPEEIEAKILKNYDDIIEIGVFENNGVLNGIIYPNLKMLHKKEIVNIEEYFRWDIIDKYNKSCTPYKKIMKFYLVAEELPKTRLGKLKRFELKGLINKKNSEKSILNEPKFEEYLLLKKFLEKETGNMVHPTDHLELDLGLDSLDKVTFSVFLSNTFGINFSENELINFNNVEQLAEYIRQEKTRIQSDVVHWADLIKGDIDIKLNKSKFPHLLIKKLCFIFFKIYFNYKINNKFNLPVSPYIIVANHQSVLDGMFVLSSLNKFDFKNTYIFAKEKHFKKYWRRFLAKRSNIVIMDINNNLSESLKIIAAVLKKGKNILIFPEGTRSRDGKLANFKNTFAILSKELKVPVVPVVINGAYKAWNRDNKFPKPFKPISVDFLVPVYPQKLNTEEIKEIVYNKIKNSLN